MFQKILIPLDGSSRAELILAQVAPIRNRAASELVFVRAISAYGPENGGYDSAPSLAHERDDAESYLHGVARRYADLGALVHTRVLEGSPPGAILDAAKREGATMIAMTTHGRTGILKWLLGSVADKVIAGSELPMLLLRPSYSTKASAAVPATPFRRILIATDGTATSMAIVEPALQFAGLFGSDVVALHVWDSYVLEGAPLPGMEAGRIAPSEAPLSSEDEVTEQVARQLGPSGLNVTRVTRYGEPASEILNHAVEHEIHLIVLAIQDQGGLSDGMNGSVPEVVLRSSRVPLLIVRGAGKYCCSPSQEEAP